MSSDNEVTEIEALKAEIEHLRGECRKLANYLMWEYTWVHEYKIEEVDQALKPYLGV